MLSDPSAKLHFFSFVVASLAYQEVWSLRVVVLANLRFRLSQLESRIAFVVQFHLDVGHSIYIFFSSALSELLHFLTDRWSETPEMKPSRIAELEVHLDVCHSIYIFFSWRNIAELLHLEELLHVRTNRWNERPEMKPSLIAELHPQ